MAKIKAVEAAEKAESVQETIQSQVASFSTQAKLSTAKVVEVMEMRVQQLVAHTDVQMSCITTEVTQQLESEIDATVMSMAAMASLHMRKAIEGMRRNLQAEL